MLWIYTQHAIKRMRIVLSNMIFHPTEKLSRKEIYEKIEKYKIYNWLIKLGILIEKDDFFQFSSPMA